MHEETDKDFSPVYNGMRKYEMEQATVVEQQDIIVGDNIKI